MLPLWLEGESNKSISHWCPSLCFSLASRMYNSTASFFLLISTEHSVTYEGNSLYYRVLVVVVQHRCLQPVLHLQENQNRVCHMKPFHGAFMAESFFSFNLQTFFPVGTWNGVSQKWNTKTFPEQGRHFRYLQLPTMVEAICKYKKKESSGLVYIIYITMVWPSLDDLGNNRHMPYGTANDTGRDGKILSHSGLSSHFILQAHTP